MEEELLRVIDGSPVGLARDPVRGSVWYYSDLHIFQVETKNEDRNLWTIISIKLYQETSMFDAAYSQCRNVEQKAKVTCARAEFLLAKGMRPRAAPYFTLRRSILRRRGAKAAQQHQSSTFVHSSSRGGGGEKKRKSLQHLTSANYVSPNSALRLATTDGPELSALRIYLLEKLRMLFVC